MLSNKIRTIISKRIFFYPFALLFIITTALAFITHSTCACGDKVEKSLLSLIVKDILSYFN
jgi:hypothetical protein